MSDVAAPVPGPSILVVDDSRTNLAVMGKRLTRMGYLVSLCDTGFAALDMMQARRFDLAILDMVMPQMSGLAVLRELRSTMTTAALPVLMLTARSDDGAAVEALGAGADDYVSKPFAFEVLGARIARLLDRAHAFEALRQSNIALDARIVRRAMELGALRSELDEARANTFRLQAEVARLGGRVAA
ncbi:response regulator transcription factor [Sphingomonas flavalba]|uniref:response regulator transcription factor n=1 Tax=Sphingomonas flavalba TaxID=2559804 RepID=UPI00109DE112|nr:response regulator [Sphingomonas flavalba]